MNKKYFGLRIESLKIYKFLQLLQEARNYWRDNKKNEIENYNGKILKEKVTGAGAEIRAEAGAETGAATWAWAWTGTEADIEIGIGSGETIQTGNLL